MGPLVDLGAINTHIDLGNIRSQTAGRLTIYTYTEQCQFGRIWDEHTRMCRGLICDGDRIVARPFEKFWNLGEPSPVLPPQDGSYRVYEKVDGSLGIWWFDEQSGVWQVATRGSFFNEYTVWAKQHHALLAKMPRELTVLTELCLPPEADGMPRAVAHRPGVYLLGARRTADGYDVSLDDLRPYWAGHFARTHGGLEISELLDRATRETGTEGWVIRYDNGFRLKIKTAWYLRIFRAISACTENHIRELMLEGGNWLAEFPEELRTDAEKISMDLAARAERLRTAVETAYQACPKDDRKTYALATVMYPTLRPLLFLRYDNRTIDLMRAILKVA